MVSAIITTHNRCDLLERAIESVLNQTYKGIECIVVDDHSSDNTQVICEKYAVKYIFIPKEESQGGNYARNIGIKIAKGDYCAFLDDDDYWLPTKIEKQVALIEKMDCELVYCGRKREVISKKGVKYVDMLTKPQNQGDMRRKILYNICTTTSTILVKRQALIDVNRFDEILRFWQEYELTIRLAQREPFYFVNEQLCVYRDDSRDSQRLTNKYYEWKKAVAYIHEKHRDLYNQLSIIEKFKVHDLVWKDARTRCLASGMKYKYLYYSFITLPLRIIEKIVKK